MAAALNSNGNGEDGDIHVYYLKCLKNEALKITDYLLENNDFFGDLLKDYDIKKLRNQAKLTKIPADKDVIRDRIEYFKDGIHKIKHNEEIRNDQVFWKFID